MQVWAWGANSNGQLGLGYESEQVSRPTEVPIMFPSKENPSEIETLLNHSNALPIKIDGGSKDTIILAENIPFSEPFEWQPNFFLLPYPKYRDIACGWDFSAYLSKDGILHTRGSNSHCQLGRQLPTPPTPQKPVSSSRSRSRSSSGSSKFTKSWGNNRSSGDFSDQSIAEDLTQISCGLRHGIVTTSNLDMLVWGNNSHNQIGPSLVRHGDDGAPTVSMKLVESPKYATVLDYPSGFETGFTHIACGKDFTVACDKEGFLYGCGVNKYGALCHAPQDVKAFGGFASIFEKIPNKFFPGNISELKCGWAHVVCLLDTGKVVTWGRNDLGQLGRPSVNPKFDVEPKMVSFPENISAIACGSEHSLALGSSGTVYSWGWNEHDNCGVASSNPGEPRQEIIRFPTKVEIPCTGRVMAIGCGAGSSFAVSCKNF